MFFVYFSLPILTARNRRKGATQATWCLLGHNEKPSMHLTIQNTYIVVGTNSPSMDSFVPKNDIVSFFPRIQFFIECIYEAFSNSYQWL